MLGNDVFPRLAVQCMPSFVARLQNIHRGIRGRHIHLLCRFGQVFAIQIRHQMIDYITVIAACRHCHDNRFLGFQNVAHGCDQRGPAAVHLHQGRALFGKRIDEQVFGALAKR